MTTLSTILDVAIGLVLTYLLLALVASGVQELIAGALHLRGRQLRDALARLLSHQGGKGVPDPALFEKVFGHPLVRGLDPRGLPSYVPARNISLALIDALSDGSQATVFSQCEQTVAKLPDGQAKATLATLLKAASGDLGQFKVSLETWYDDAMDRLGGIYKRFSHYCLLTLGIALAVGLNVDSIRIAETLWLDPALRAQLVAQAQALDESAGNTQNSANPVGKAQDAESALAALPVPMGWHGTPGQFVGARLAWALLGWVITGFAISLGAPFWFDALDGLLKLRNSGAKPARST